MKPFTTLDLSSHTALPPIEWRQPGLLSRALDRMIESKTWDTLFEVEGNSGNEDSRLARILIKLAFLMFPLF
jgi:hypothetical protein